MQAFLKGTSKPAGVKDKTVAETSGSAKVTRKRLQPWVEKYRPNRMDEVAYQEEVVAVLKSSVIKLDLPNLLFYGPPGTGKTSTILAASKELFGDMYRDRILELNASDERGINVVREKVKNFAQLTASAIRPDGRPCPPFKIIILDEADSMTAAAQAALRRTMETESRTTRFCLICNYVTRIIEPITSRCAKFRFKPLPREVLTERLRLICEREGVTCGEEALNTLIETSEGDMRKAITTLQSAARLRVVGGGVGVGGKASVGGSEGEVESITKSDIVEISGIIEDDVILNLIKACRSASHDKLDTAVKDLMAEGHSAGQIVLQLHDVIVPSRDVSDSQKSTICERLAVVDKRLLDGADEYLQVMDLCSVIMQQVCYAT